MKGIFKKWWFYAIILIVILIISNSNKTTTQPSNNTNENLENVVSNNVSSELKLSDYPNIEKICKDYIKKLKSVNIDIVSEEFKYAEYHENTYYNTMKYYTENQDSASLKFDDNQNLIGITLMGNGENVSKDYLNMRLGTIYFLNFSESEEEEIIKIISNVSLKNEFEPNKLSLKEWEISVIPDTSIIRTTAFSKKK